MTVVSIVLPLLAGLVLGFLYFGGLWLTLRKLASAKQPAFLVLGSYLGRLVLCLAGFAAVAVTTGLRGILICTAAFIAVRVIMVRRWGKPGMALTGTEESC